MSVAIATMGLFIPAVGGGGVTIDNGSAPYEYGGGILPGTVPSPKRLKVNVSFLEVNKTINERKLEISPIKVIL